MLAHFFVKPTAVPSALTHPSNFSKSNKNKSTNTINNKKSYTSALKINIEDIIDILPTLSLKKIVNINNIINKSNTVKPKINITTKVSELQILDYILFYFLLSFYFYFSFI